MLTREICKECFLESAVGFSVPDPIWNQVAEPDSILCIACFTKAADGLGLVWDDDIRFWPVSRATFESLNS